MSVSELSSKYNEANLNELVDEWQRLLELHVPEDKNVDITSITDFNNRNSSHLKEIE